MISDSVVSDDVITCHVMCFVLISVLCGVHGISGVRELDRAGGCAEGCH